jgi:hypothetical protein
MDGEIMPFIQAEGTDLQSKIFLLQPHLPPDLIQWADVIRDDVREVMGIGRAQSGELPSGRHTATESQIVQAAHDLRMSDRRSAVGEALTRVMRKVNQTIGRFWDTEKVARVIGVEGAVYWVSFRADQLANEYDMKVNVEAAIPGSKAQRRQDLIQLIQALGSNPAVNIQHLVAMFLTEFDYLDVMKVLPQAAQTLGGPMGQNEFIGQQNQLLGNGQQFGEAVAGTQQFLQGAAPSLLGG